MAKPFPSFLSDGPPKGMRSADVKHKITNSRQESIEINVSVVNIKFSLNSN